MMRLKEPDMKIQPLMGKDNGFAKLMVLELFIGFYATGQEMIETVSSEVSWRKRGKQPS